MQFFAAFKSIIPEFHAFSDQDQRYNIGATWTGVDGLKDYHNLELRYVRNSERREDLIEIANTLPTTEV